MSRPLTVPRLRLPAKKTRPIADFCKRLVHLTANGGGQETGGAKGVTGLLEELLERGLRVDRRRLFVIDGAKALRSAIGPCSARGTWCSVVELTRCGTSWAICRRRSTNRRGRRCCVRRGSWRPTRVSARWSSTRRGWSGNGHRRRPACGMALLSCSPSTASGCRWRSVGA